MSESLTDKAVLTANDALAKAEDASDPWVQTPLQRLYAPTHAERRGKDPDSEVTARLEALTRIPDAVKQAANLNPSKAALSVFGRRDKSDPPDYSEANCEVLRELSYKELVSQFEHWSGTLRDRWNVEPVAHMPARGELTACIHRAAGSRSSPRTCRR